jgi:hypothetical protein
MLALLFRRNPGSSTASSRFALPHHSGRDRPVLPHLVTTKALEQLTNVVDSSKCASRKSRKCQGTFGCTKESHSKAGSWVTLSSPVADRPAPALSWREILCHSRLNAANSKSCILQQLSIRLKCQSESTGNRPATSAAGYRHSRSPLPI